MDKEQRYLYGTPVIETLSHYYVDKAFIGIGGLTMDGFSASEEEGKIKHQMMKSAKGHCARRPLQDGKTLWLSFYRLVARGCTHYRSMPRSGMAGFSKGTTS